MVRKIPAQEMHRWGRRVGLRLNEDEVEAFLDLSARMLDGLEALESMPMRRMATIDAVRQAHGRPGEQEDPYNAIIHKCHVAAHGEGALAGKRIGLKDSIAVAGIPMTCGSRLLDGYVPEIDSVVAERLLAAGAVIVAKLNMDDFAFSAGGETSLYGPVSNPHDANRTASGSSSGPAAALYYDSIDVTFGTDQGGSVRLPASWCGTLGLKPTYGLVPYTGIASVDVTYDHVGPLARTVEDLAAALAAVAGGHPSDPRQRREIVVGEYVAAVRHAPEDLRGVEIGVLTEGFSAGEGVAAPDGTRQTADAVRMAIERMRALGATIREVTIPEHSMAVTVKLAALAEGYAATFHAHGNSYHQEAPYWDDFAAALGKGMKLWADDLHATAKSALIVGNYLRERYLGSFYAKARNWAPVLRDAYDRVLSDVDFVVMPTATHYAHQKAPDVPLAESVWRSWTSNANTAAANVSGHPAVSLPAAEADGLPVGVMVVGKAFAEAELLSFARTYEQAQGWLPA